MRLPVSWLKEYVNITLPVEELAHRLTMAGTEVSSAERIGGQWQNIFVGQVTAVTPHPNADRLRLATITLGAEAHTVVCGAPNVAPGQKVAFARVGAELIDEHTGKTTTLKPAKIRGVVSEGMACSEKELGLSDDHTKIIELPADAPLGAPLADYLGDIIWDLKVTPNRPDLLSVIGIAREVSALTGQPLRLPSLTYPEAGPAINQLAGLEILDPDLCPRYCGGVITGLKVGPSPQWMQKRLAAAGMRPINNIVDITNYVMLEFGQPLHAFNLETLQERRIVVRRAREGETLTSLDGVPRGLDSSMLVIADAQRPVAVAGVMGGLDTEVTDRTTSILLESANFNFTNLRQTAAVLHMRTEASIRFEKGLNPELASRALRRAMALVLELAGGQAAKDILDAYPGIIEATPILVTAKEMERILGVDMELAKIQSALSSLGFDYQSGENASEVNVFIPYWRSDVRIPADLAEEVARIIGYGQIPTTLLHGQLPQRLPETMLDFRERVRGIMVACGLQEVINYSLVSQEKLSQVGASLSGLKVTNPLSPEQERLRTSLRPGLLSTLSYNLPYNLPSGDDSIRLFEAGRVYLPRENFLPEEREHLGVILAGYQPRYGKEQGGSDPLGFDDIKGIAEALLCRLGVSAIFEQNDDSFLHPIHQAKINVQSTQVGKLGEIHPQIAEAFSVQWPASWLEIDLQALIPFTTAIHAFQPLPRFPAVLRDLALVLDQAIPSLKVEQVIQAERLVAQVIWFDMYTGNPIPQGKKSLAYHIVYQSPDRTLTDEEVDKVQERILSHLQKELGASLRT